MDICNKNLAYSQMQVFLFLFKDSSPKGAHKYMKKNSINPEIAWKGGSGFKCREEKNFFEGDKT